MRSSNEILDEIRRLKGLGSDAALGALFGVKQSTVASWRSRNTLPYEAVIAFCAKEGISTDSMFLEKAITWGEIKPPQPGVVAEEPERFQPGAVDANRQHAVLINTLQRILDEGDKINIEAVKGMLKAFDPDVKKGQALTTRKEVKAFSHGLDG